MRLCCGSRQPSVFLVAVLCSPRGTPSAPPGGVHWSYFQFLASKQSVLKLEGQSSYPAGGGRVPGSSWGQETGTSELEGRVHRVLQDGGA